MSQLINDAMRRIAEAIPGELPIKTAIAEMAEGQEGRSHEGIKLPMVEIVALRPEGLLDAVLKTAIILGLAEQAVEGPGKVIYSTCRDELTTIVADLAEAAASE